MSKIKLNTGIYFDFANPSPKMITLHDIAHNNSKEQRFSNCLSRDWSVLHHSLFVYELVKREDGSFEQQYIALHHDSPEAYMKDIPTPLKNLLSDYKKIYREVEKAIEDKLQVKIHPLDDLVHMYDKAAMNMEDALYSTTESAWHSTTEDNINREVKKIVHKLYILRQWQVYQTFIKTHHFLTRKLNLKIESHDNPPMSL